MTESGDDKGSIDIACNHRNIDGATISVERPVLHDASLKLGSEKFPIEPDEVHSEKPSCSSPRIAPVTDADPADCCCAHDASESSPKGQSFNEPDSLQADQKSFLNCYLGNSFIFRSDGLSKEIEWIDFTCPQCSWTLGAYPCCKGSEPLDGGIRLLKCYISISPSSVSLDNLFSKYTLERMFTCQLVENAKDELSFRTVVKDLKTRSSMLHIVLLNPNSWCCTGYCSEGIIEPIVKINLHPVVKVLFSHCFHNPDSKPRIDKEWETKNQADEIYMSAFVIRELIKSTEEATGSFPPSFSSSPGFLLASMPR